VGLSDNELDPLALLTARAGELVTSPCKLNYLEFPDSWDWSAW